MSSKVCKYCKSRMIQVIHGLPNEDDGLETDEFVEFAGCIISQTTPDWRCPTCDSRVIGEISPSGGYCVKELPTKFRSKLTDLCRKLSNYEVWQEEEMLSLTCPFESDYPMDESEFDLHMARGDYLRIHVCGCQELFLFLDGSGYTDQVVLDWIPPSPDELISRLVCTAESLNTSLWNLSDSAASKALVEDVSAMIRTRLARCENDLLCEYTPPAWKF